MEPTSLEEQFGIPGVLSFAGTPSGLTYATIKTAAAGATVFLQGAHLTHWQPAGHDPVLFLSSTTDLLPGKAIRGGVPIAFPWFAADTKQDRIVSPDGSARPGPSHGFARIEKWTLAFAALVPDKTTGDALHLTFTLGPTALSRTLGFDSFRAAFQITVGHTLTLRLTIANDAETPLLFEEALHTYFRVADIREVTLRGLEATPFLDKTADFARNPAADAPLTFSGPIDRIYDGTTATCIVEDHDNRRRITVAKTNSQTTVVFNPWKAMPDLPADEWPLMLCVETVNASAGPVTLGPGATHTMQAVINVSASPDPIL